MFVLLFISACSSSTGSGDEQEGASSGNGDSSEGEVVYLNFWAGIPPESGPQDLVDRWNEENPHIQVEYTRFVNDDSGNTRLETALLAGNVDVFINYRWGDLQQRVSNGLMAPIDSFLASENFDLEENFGEHAYETNGEHFFIPTLGGPRDFIIYNKDMVEEAGIVIPDRWTWDEYMEIAKKLTHGEGNNKVYGSIAPADQVVNHWANPAKNLLNGDYMYKDGLAESNFDHEALLRSLEIRHQMENIDESQISLFEIKSANLDMAAAFTRGEVAMINAANFLLRDIRDLERYPHDFVTAFAPYPTLYEDQEEVWSGGLREWISISSRTSHEEAAWEFLKYYATEGYYPMTRSIRIPAWLEADTSLIAEEFFGDSVDYFDLESFDRVVINNPMHRDKVIVRSEAAGRLQQIATEESEMALLGDKTVEEAIQAMKDRADRAIQEDQ